MVAVVDGQVVRRRLPTRVRAADEYAKLRSSVNDGTYIAAERSRVPFAEYAELWLGGLQIRPSSLAQYRSNLHPHPHLLPAFGITWLDRIERPQVLALVRNLSDNGLAPATTRGIVNLLRTTLRPAVNDGGLLMSPCVRITLPELPPKHLAVFTDEQVAALTDAVHPQHRRCCCSASAPACCRASCSAPPTGSSTWTPARCGSSSNYSPPPGGGRRI